MSIQGPWPWSKVIQIRKLKLVFLRNHWAICKFYKKAFRNKEMKVNKYEFGHMTNMAAVPVYGKII